MKNYGWLLILLFGIFFISCRNNANDNNANNKQNNSNAKIYYYEKDISDTIPDSVKIERYLTWLDSVEFISNFHYNTDTISTLETKRDTVLLWNFLNIYKDSLPILYFLDPDYSGYVTQPPLSCLYSIDINNDGNLDIIYHGPSGGLPLITIIYLNTDNEFIEVFSGVQDIIDFNFSANKLNSFVLYNPGCCADPQILEYEYSVSFSDIIPKFKLIKTIGYISSTEKPEKEYSQHKSFMTIKNKSRLRNECYFLDDADIGVTSYNFHGNIITEYSKGSKGKCLGSKTVNGEEWVFVIMDPVKKSDSCYFSSFTEQPTMIKGWMLKSDTDL